MGKLKNKNLVAGFLNVNHLHWRRTLVHFISIQQ